MEKKHTMSDLYQMQALPLTAKIRMTERRILDWVDYYGENGVYVSFSGGKDSTVLMDIVRNRLGIKIPAVFVDVPTQFPELKEFAQTWDDVEVLKPKISFVQVCEKYGFPMISKEVSEAVNSSKKYLTSVINKQNALTDRQTVAGAYAFADMIGVPRRKEERLEETYQNLRKGIIPSDLKFKYGEPVRLLQLKGKVPHKEKGVLTDEYSKRYDKSKYAFMLDAPFEISNMCCKVMKKNPLHSYSKKTGRRAITAQMASESILRTSQWLKNGCNGFEMKEPISNPMSFWTEQDVLLYIKENNIPICSVYGDIVEDWDRFDGVEGQMTLSDLRGCENMELFDADRPLLKTTGCNRTGCMLCGFGCHLNNDNRFTLLKETHPKMYALLDVIKNNGVTMREAIEWINEHGNLNIRL